MVVGGLGLHRVALGVQLGVGGVELRRADTIEQTADMLRKMEKQRNQDEQNWKAQMDAVHDVLDTKVNEKPFEDLKHCAASLTKGARGKGRRCRCACIYGRQKYVETSETI